LPSAARSTARAATWSTANASHAWRTVRAAALSSSCNQIVSSLNVAIQLLHQFRIGMIADPSFYADRLNRLVRQELPADRRVVLGSLNVSWSRCLALFIAAARTHAATASLTGRSVC